MRPVLLASLFVTSVFLFACEPSVKKDDGGIGRYGMMSEDTPQYASVIFLRALYSEDTLEPVLSMSSDKYAKVLSSYHTPRGVQRHILNLRLDPAADIQPQSSKLRDFNTFSKNTYIDVRITGQYNGDKVVELKTLHLVKVSGKWKVDDITNTVQ